MKNKQLLLLLFSITLFLAISFVSCQKYADGSNQAGKQNVALYLNDDPSYNFTKVLVDIRFVEIKVDTGRHDAQHDDDDDDDDDDNHGYDEHGQWDTLQITPGVYDLLRLRNGVDTLLANGFILNGRITKVRFTLGNNNSVYTDSVTSQPLSICDNKRYVYAKVKSDAIDVLPNGQISLHIDFNVTKSIKLRNGAYCLKGELKAYSQNGCGKIEGKVFPRAARPLIKVFNATDTAYAIPFSEGEYKVTGLKAGTYTVYFDATSPYIDTTINNVIVTRGNETHLPNIVLHQ
ncbi:DUF4382 domain-containing protein [Ferruginibacter yonginensis]|uniref:DUF4382 domain-containing protein n=1 Tax=Ferruginibacter yonginensis TaxID=1310416 RepID=A0ABV8QTS2_9BACT